MKLNELYSFLDDNIGVDIFPIMVPVDHTGDCITYNLDRMEYDENFDGEDNFYQAILTFFCVSPKAVQAIEISEELEGLLEPFTGELVTGGQYVQDTRLLDKRTMYDDGAKVYGVGLTVQFTYNT